MKFDSLLRNEWAFLQLRDKGATIEPLRQNRKPTRKSHWFNVEPYKAIQA